MTPISLQKISNRGLSLIEVLIAVAIMVTSLIIVMPQIQRSENKIKKTLRDLQSLNRTLYSYSRIKNKVYRLALKVNKNESSYWVEIKQNLSEKTKEEKPTDHSLLKNMTAEKSHPFFEKDLNFDEQILPYGFFFDWPETSELPELSEDILYITYSPHYFSESSSILVRTQKDFFWTLFFNPLSGELEITEGDSSIAQKKIL